MNILKNDITDTLRKQNMDSTLTLVIILLLGYALHASDDLNVVEYCYDGVVYIGEYSYSNLSVKFDNKGNVVTTTVDGKACQ